MKQKEERHSVSELLFGEKVCMYLINFVLSLDEDEFNEESALAVIEASKWVARSVSMVNLQMKHVP